MAAAMLFGGAAAATAEPQADAPQAEGAPQAASAVIPAVAAPATTLTSIPAQGKASSTAKEETPQLTPAAGTLSVKVGPTEEEIAAAAAERAAEQEAAERAAAEEAENSADEQDQADDQDQAEDTTETRDEDDSANRSNERSSRDDSSNSSSSDNSSSEEKKEEVQPGAVRRQGQLDPRHRPQRHRHPLRLRRHLDLRLGLLRLRPVGLRTARHQPAARCGRPGRRRHGHPALRGAAGRPGLQAGPHRYLRRRQHLRRRGQLPRGHLRAQHLLRQLDLHPRRKLIPPRASSPGPR